jgi:SpoVK/Ycf46/Vps4 family AAA+-type ATPase
MIGNVQMSLDEPSLEKKQQLESTSATPLRTHGHISTHVQLQSALKCRSVYSVQTFQDLFQLLKEIKHAPSSSIPPELGRLQDMEPCLEELQAMVGQKKLKQDLLKLLLFCAQGFHKTDNAMMNLCLFGQSGLGKTALTKIIADIYYHAGLLQRTAFNQKERYLRGTRSNMIGRFLGETPRLTQALINQAITEQKVLLIDEAYQMNHPEKRDSFSKELLDTLNQNLSEYPSKLRVIIAGYKQDVIDCFFAANSGLERRINFTFELEEYSHGELREIFFQQLMRCNCDVHNIWNVGTEAWFQRNKDAFLFAGGDMENLAKEARINAAQRSFGLPYFLKNKIKQCDLDTAVETLKQRRLKQQSIDVSHFYL